MTVLVTGAAGMLGRALTDALLARGIPVRSFDLLAHPDPRVQSVIGDLRDAPAVTAACAGVDTVFHTASVVYLGLGRPDWVHEVNVQGTQHVIDGCCAQGVPGWSTPARSTWSSTAGRLLRAGDQFACPIPDHPLDWYSETKIAAEQRVLAANGAVLAVVVDVT
jgi:nucleoside-diphosphate-sugar epimerase